MSDNLPFAGLRVLELAAVLAGPQVGQFFAELGANVLKVEPPAGDVTRTWRTPGDNPDSSVSAYFAASNWGKKSLTLDLTQPAAQAELYRLAPSGRRAGSQLQARRRRAVRGYLRRAGGGQPAPHLRAPHGLRAE
ncbi:MAG: CoA transferase [Hymenobacter sp.]